MQFFVTPPGRGNGGNGPDTGPTEGELRPKWMHGSGKGWVTAEYDMLPRATNSRKGRDSHRGKINGRTQEIGRLIGRSLRSVVDMQKLGERMITIDCDVESRNALTF